jgi:hypothetical protein
MKKTGDDKWEIGPDGQPTSLDHPWNRDKRTAAQVRAERFGQEMRRLELAFHGGHSKALKLAVEMCGHYGEVTPEDGLFTNLDVCF